MADVPAPAFPGYPAPPAPSQGVLSGNPLALIPALSQIQEYGIRQQQAPALGQQPAAALQGQNIQNTTLQAQQEATFRELALRAFATGLAGKDNPTADDVHTLSANFARANPTIAATRPDIINATADLFLKGKSVKDGVTTALNMLTPADAGLVTVTGPGGQPMTMTRQQANARAIGTPGPTAPGSLPGFPSGLPAGEEVPLAAAAKAAATLENTGSTSPQYHADLENLKQDSAVLDNLGGPTIDVERKLNALTQRVAKFGITMTPDQMRAGDSFVKIANQMSLNQASAMAGTDAGRDMTLHANPSAEMSRYGRDGVIDMLQGNQDFVDTTRKVWLAAKKAGAPANSFYTFAQQFGNEPLNPTTGAKADPRVFQFARMSPANQQTFLNQVGPDDLGQFEANYQEAIKRGWVKPLKKPNAAQ